jgi:hypothetical protein
MFSEIKLCANVFTFKTVKRFKGFFPDSSLFEILLSYK